MEEIISDPLPQKEFLPEASLALKYSIWGNALGFLFFVPVLGIAGCIAALIISIIGLNKGKSGMMLYRADKLRYDKGSFVKTLIAFILGIVGIVQASLLSIYAGIFTFLMKEIFRF
ncbi:MAG TPA: hypothetical protein PKW80_03100 [Bacteroidales bacterium]|nr:hypothetical protein [Bacteroidales bacterium]